MTVNFTTINHEARIKLGLSWHEYGLADLIYNLANNPKSSSPGWCYASKISLGQTLGFTERGVQKLVVKLIDAGLVERNEETKFLRTTNKWYKTAIVKDPEQSSPTTNNVRTKYEQRSPDGTNNVHPTYIKNKDINNIDKSITTFGNPDINEVLSLIKSKFSLPALDGSEKVNRQYAFHLIRKLKNVSSISTLIDMAVSDPWYSKNITSAKDLYYNAVKIASRKRGGAIYVED